jgi:hypothetical protein
MPPRPVKPLFPNPFYVLVLVASTLFVVTALAYLISPLVSGTAPAGRETIAAWFDRHAPLALGVEFAVMLGAGALAMTTDQWFPAKPTRPNRPEP